MEAIIVASTMMKIAARAVNKSFSKSPPVLETFPRLKSTAKMTKPRRIRVSLNILISFLYSGVGTISRTRGVLLLQFMDIG
jgi:hypothetical protein